MSHLTLACLESLTCQVIDHVPEEILAIVKVSSSQKLEPELERNFG